MGLVTAPFTLFQAYEAICGKLKATKESRESDRHYMGVNRICVELRRFEKGESRQELVVSQEIHEPFDPRGLAQIVCSALRARD